MAWNGNRAMTCQSPFVGTHCEKINAAPVIQSVEAKFYTAGKPGDHTVRDFAESGQGVYLRYDGDKGNAEGGVSPTHYTNFKDLEIQLTWGHHAQYSQGTNGGQVGFSGGAVGIAYAAATIDDMTEGANGKARPKSYSGAATTVNNIAVRSGGWDRGSGTAPNADYSWTRPGSAPSRDSPHTSSAFGMKATFQPSKIRPVHCLRFPIRMSVVNGGYASFSWFYNKASSARRSSKKYLYGQQVVKTMPVTVDYSKPTNSKPGTAAIEIVGCDPSNGWKQGEGHDDLGTQKWAQSEHGICSATSQKEVTIKISNWKDDCSPIYKYHVYFCPMNPLPYPATLISYYGANVHTGVDYCKPNGKGGIFVANKMVGRKRVMIPPISKANIITGAKEAVDSKFHGSTSTEPGAMGSMGSAEFTFKRNFGDDHVGLWSAEVAVEDEAGNIEFARRFVLHDPDPRVDYHERWGNSQKDGGPKILSAGCSADALHSKEDAAEGESGVWQSIHHGGAWSYDCLTGNVPSGARELWQWNDTFVHVSWKNMFSSRSEPYLNAIRGVHGLKEEYDDSMVCGPAACPPASANILRRKGIPNYHGITKYEIAITSSTGGKDVIPKWTLVPFQGGPGEQTAHVEEVRDFEKATGKPASQMLIAIEGTHEGDPDLFMENKIENGHVYNIEIRATEPFGNQLIKRTQLRIDITPPEILKLGLEKDGEQELAVHNLEDLTKMNLEFEAFDLESGLRQIEWRLHKHTNEFLDHCKEGEWEAGTCDQVTDPNVWLDDQSEMVTLEEDAVKCENHPGDACLCTAGGDFCHLRDYKFNLEKFVKGDTNLVDGQHNRNYTFELTVTNRAGLMSTERLMVQVDLTPPVAGAVNDSAFGNPDADFQQSHTLEASFFGFVDPDSGIRTYMYAWSSKCLAGPDEFDKLDLTDFNRTAKQTVTWESPGPGTYYLTAFAYNNAWSASRVVCSDGITVDDKAATVTDIRIDHAFARPGIVWGSNTGLTNPAEKDALWILHSNMTRQRVVGMPDPCSGTCCNPPDMSEPGGLGAFKRVATSNNGNGHAMTLPTYDAVQADSSLANACDLPGGTPAIYLASEKVLSLTWTTDAALDSVIDFEIGLGKTAVTGKDQVYPVADIMPYRRTNRKYHASIIHPPLETGEMAYLLVKVIKRNKMNKVTSFGPLFVDSTAPSKGAITAIDAASVPNYVVIRWSGFDDAENPATAGIASNVGPLMYVGIHVDGEGEGNGNASSMQSNSTALDNKSPFQLASDLPGACNNKPGCLSLPGKDIADIMGSYKIVLKACSSSQQCSITVSDVQQGIAHSNPSRDGVVSDLDPTVAESAVTVAAITDSARTWVARRASAETTAAKGNAVAPAARDEALTMVTTATAEIARLFEAVQPYRVAPSLATRRAATALLLELGPEMQAGTVVPDADEYVPDSKRAHLHLDCLDLGDLRCKHRPDVDYQNSLTQVAASWTGFQFGGEHVMYEYGVSSTPNGVPDIVNFVPVPGNTVTSAVLDVPAGLLKAGTMYYNLIKARNVVGDTIVASDGFWATSLELDFPLQVLDGPGCSNAATVYSLGAPVKVGLKPVTSTTSTTVTTTTTSSASSTTYTSTTGTSTRTTTSQTTTTTNPNITHNNTTVTSSTTTTTTTTTSITTATTTTTLTEKKLPQPPKPCPALVAVESCEASPHGCRWVPEAQWQSRPGEYQTRGVCIYNPGVNNRNVHNDGISTSNGLGEASIALASLHNGELYTVTLSTRVTDAAGDGSTSTLRVFVGGMVRTIDTSSEESTIEFTFASVGPENMVLQIPAAGSNWGTLSGGLSAANFAGEYGEIEVTKLDIVRCSAESDAFSSTEHFTARWDTTTTAPSSPALPFSHFEWTIELLEEEASAENGTTAADPTPPPAPASLFAAVRPFVTAGAAEHNVGDASLIATLESGMYRTAVRPCTPIGCYGQSVSNGFAYASTLPEPRSITASYAQPAVHDGSTELVLEWEEFDHGNVPVPVYTWTLATSSAGHGIFLPWTAVVSTQLQAGVTWDAGKVTVQQSYRTVDFSMRDFNVPIFLLLRAVGADGQAFTSATRAVPTSVLARAHMVAILDVKLSESTLLETPEPVDVHYTDSLNTLAAEWPELWREFTPDYFVYSITTIRQYSTKCEAILKTADDVTEPRSNVTSRADDESLLACGLTAGSVRSAANSGLLLEHGAKYYFCARIGTTTIDNPVDGKKVFKNENVLPSCSNGVTVDWTPPRAGSVTLGSALRAKPSHSDEWFGGFQSINDRVKVAWHGFADDEEYDLSHPTGIARYTLELGTSFKSYDLWHGDVGGVLGTTVTLDPPVADGTTIFANVTAFDYNHRAVSAQAMSPLTIDASPPEARGVTVQMQAGEKEGTIDVHIVWQEFVDVHSGIAVYKVGVGGEHGCGDYVEFEHVGRRLEYDATVVIAQGHTLYATVRATNFAGLSSEGYSLVQVVATETPQAGFVHDGRLAGHDIDYQTDSSTLAANWGGFSGAVSYSWAIGTKQGQTDVMGWVSAGAMTHAMHNGLSLQAGLLYYVGIHACNLHSVCTEVYSDGVRVDVSPPHGGVVEDGFQPGDARMQAFAGAVGASFHGFADPESGIDHYEWCVGSSTLKCDVQGFVSVGTATRVVNVNQDLPSNGDSIYVTVRAYNGAGLHTDVSSNGVFADTTPPTVVEKPTWIPIGPLVNADFDLTKDTGAYQHAGSVLRAKWKFSDQGSALSYHYTIDTHNDGVSAIADSAVGLEDGLFLTRLNLIDGDRYFLSVTACDEAGLCTTAEADDGRGILVDSSPPVTGGMLNSMTWKADALTLEWTGFSDPHSGIHEYLVAVGTTYGGTDVVTYTVVEPACKFEASKICDAEVGNYRTYGFTTEYVRANKIIADTNDAITRAELTTKFPLKHGNVVFISLKARNRAGLWSTILHTNAQCSSQDQDAGASSGILQVVHHGCEAYGCNPDRSGPRCACGASNRCPGQAEEECDATGSSIDCTVFDGSDIGKDTSYQPETRTISANWKIAGGSASYVRAETTVTLKGESAPDYSLFHRPTDNHHGVNVWTDVGHATTSVFTVLNDGLALVTGETYVTWVRVWTTLSSFQDFQSDGIMIEITPPHVNKRQSHHGVKEVLHSGDNSGGGPETDVVANITEDNAVLTISWEKVFAEDHELSYFEYAFGTEPLSTNLIPFTRVDDLETQSVDVDASALNLEQHHRYYSLVRAVNVAGLQSWRSSDGMVIDSTPPIAGVVHDGPGPADLAFQSDTTQIEAHWKGFGDADSSLKNYEWSIGTAPGKEDVLNFTDVGMETSAIHDKNLSLEPNATYFVSVRSFNILGAVSAVSHSDGVTIDVSKPSVHICIPNATAENLVGNPSFEEEGAKRQPAITSTTTTTTTVLAAYKGVTLNASMFGDAAVVAGDARAVEDGDSRLRESEHQCQYIDLKTTFHYNITNETDSGSSLSEESIAVELLGVLSNEDGPLFGSKTADVSGHRSITDGILLQDATFNGGGASAEVGDETFCDARCIFSNVSVAGETVAVAGSGTPVWKEGAATTNLVVDGNNVTADYGILLVAGDDDAKLYVNRTAVAWFTGTKDGTLTQATKIVAENAWATLSSDSGGDGGSGESDGSDDAGESTDDAVTAVVISVCDDDDDDCIVDYKDQTMVAVNESFAIEIGQYILANGTAACALNSTIKRTEWPGSNGGGASRNNGGDNGDGDGKDSNQWPNPKDWVVSAHGVAWHSNSDHRYGDRSFAFRDNGGTATHTFATVAGMRYILTFAAAVNSESIGAMQVGGVQIRDIVNDNNMVLEHMFVARRTTDGAGEPWMELSYRFAAASELHAITVYGVGSHAGGAALLVDSVNVMLCSTVAVSGSSAITVPAAVSGRSLKAHWAAYDGESGVEDAFWAIGTTAGGDQLQPFTSVGQAESVEASHLHVEHGESMYVTVVIQNGAGLSLLVGGSGSGASTATSPATIVDWTPPEGLLFDGNGAADADGHASLVLSANLQNIADPESGIRSCSWSFGRTPGTADLSAWKGVVPNDDGTLPIVTMAGAIEALDGLMVYATARCVNGAGLLAVIHSDGAYLQLQPPAAALGAFVRVLSPPGNHVTQVPAALGHQTNSDVVHVVWEGFAADARMVGHYEARLVGPGLSSSNSSGKVEGALSFVNTGVRQQTMFGPGLDLQESTLYTAEVVMVNAAGVKAAAVKAGVWVDTSPPVAANAKDAKERFCATFDGSKGLTVGWPSIFAETGCADGGGSGAAGCLIYRYNVGTSAGAGNVVRWKDSSNRGADANAVIVLRDLAKDKATGLLDLAKEYYVTVAAYNLAGLGVAQTFRVQSAKEC